MSRFRRRILFLLLPLVTVLGVAGCSTGATLVRGGPAPGARTAVIADRDPRPVAEDPVPPSLPATVRSFDGVDVTVTDVSRIVTADRSGTLAQTVFSLGLGDNLVGRSTASFPASEHLPNVTPAGTA